MVGNGLRQPPRVTIGALLLAAALAGCGLVPVPPPNAAPSLAIQIQISDGPAGLVRDAGRLTLMATFPGGGVSAVTSATDSPARTAIHLVSFGGETGRVANTFVFGNAPPGASSIEVMPGPATGSVAGGLFLVAIPEKDLLPSNLTWRFLSSAGSVIEAGIGITE